MRSSKKIKVLFLPPQSLPIPAIGGGAIETLLTSLIKQNEVLKEAEFVFVSKYHKDAIKQNYEHSKVYYFDNEICIEKKINNLLARVGFLFHRLFKTLIRLIFANRVTIKIFKNEIQSLDYFLYQVLRIVRKERVDFFINESFNYNIGKLAIIAKKIGIKKMIYHAHCVSNAPNNFCNYYSLLIGISDFVTKEWIKTSPRLIGKTLYNGINISKYVHNLSFSVKSQLRESLGIKQNDFVVLFVGRIIPEKGIKELVLSFNQLANNKIKLIVIGTPYFSLGKSTEFARKVIQDMNNNKNIIYLGYVENSHIPLYQSIANIQIVPSIWEEGAGLVSIEGMASGLPLIITNSGGMPEYTGDKSAIIINRQPNLIKDIKSTILMLMKNKKLCDLMSNSGKSRAKRFTEEEMYLNFIKILEDKMHGYY